MRAGRGGAAAAAGACAPSRGRAALNRFARAWLAAFEARKRALGLLDFDDMIDRAQALLDRARDRGLGALAARRRPRPHPRRRGAGHQPGAVAGDRGDLGGVLRRRAAPAAARADDLRRRRREAVDLQLPGRRPGGVRREARATTSGCWPGSARELQRCDLLYSFRSAPADPAAGGRGLRRRGRRGPRGRHHPPRHRSGAARARRALAVPAEARQARRARPGTSRSTRVDARRSRSRCWRDRIAARIAGWLREGRALPGEADGRAIRAGDVMILVQRRGPIFDAVIRALKRARVPVAGADLLRDRRRAGGQRPARGAALRGDAAATTCRWRRFLRSPLGGVERARALRAGARPATAASGQALRRQPAERWARGAGAARGPARPGGFPAAVRAARADADPPRRPAQAGRAARGRGGGRHRRAARPGAGLRAASRRRA